MKTKYLPLIVGLGLGKEANAQTSTGQSLLQRIFASEQAQANIPSGKILRAQTKYDTDRGDLHYTLQHEHLYWGGEQVGEKCTVTETKDGKERVQFTDNTCDGLVDSVTVEHMPAFKEVADKGLQPSYENLLNLFVQ